MKSKVFFIDLRADNKKNLLDKISDLLNEAGLSNILEKNDLTAVKLHFGEPGNTSFIRPVFIRKIIEIIKKAEAEPFLTDANTLYAGKRSDAVNHLTSAVQNGFGYSTVEAPIIIADGVRGKSETEVEVNLKRFKKVYIGREIIEADFLLSAAHFKGHEISGFGGTIKNLGMGCASRRGKLAQHSNLSPKIKGKLCKSCGTCKKHCPSGAISVKPKEKAKIDEQKCIGCGGCIAVCPEHAIDIRWNESVPVFLEKMVEYTAGVLKNKKDKAFFINFIMDVSPACDCHSFNDAPIVKNIGIVASTDPVAIDKASVDLVNNEPGILGSCLKNSAAPGDDKFKDIYPYINWESQFVYAEEIGLGKQEYELIRL